VGVSVGVEEGVGVGAVEEVGIREVGSTGLVGGVGAVVDVDF
jgi:hypothetical protein